MTRENYLHNDLKEQYNRYRLLAVAMVVVAIVPVATLIGLYLTGPGLKYLGERMLMVVVAFVLEIPLVLGLAYLLSYKRMKFLERSSELVQRGIREELPMVGLYKLYARDGAKLCCVDLIAGADNSVQRLHVIPNAAMKSFVDDLPDAPDPSNDSVTETPMRAVIAYVDPETKLPVAIEEDGVLLWISPPASAI